MSSSCKSVIGWCDGSTHGGTGVSSVVILTDETHVASLNTPLEDVSDSTETELYGAFSILKKMHDEYLGIYEDITIMIDSESIVKTFYKLQERSAPIYEGKYTDLWICILDYAKGFKVEFKHYRGHSVGINPNKVVDIKGRMLRRCGMDML